MLRELYSLIYLYHSSVAQCIKSMRKEIILYFIVFFIIYCSVLLLTKVVTKGWIFAHHPCVLEMLMIPKGATSCFLKASTSCTQKNTHFGFISNPRVSKLHPPNSINLVIIQYTGFLFFFLFFFNAYVTNTLHLSPAFMWPRPWSDKKADQVALFQLWRWYFPRSSGICDIERDKQNQQGD